jgi:hypothetical protein
MPVLTPGQPVVQGEPVLLVENKLKPGRYRFQLVVADDSGLESDPAEMVVTVRERAPDPTPTPTPTGPVIRPDVLERLGRLERLERVERVRPINPRILRPRGPQG